MIDDHSNQHASKTAYDFLLLRAEGGEAPATHAEWWTRFQDASPEVREAMLKPDEAPKKRRRSRGRGRKHGDEVGAAGVAPGADAPQPGDGRWTGRARAPR